MKRRDFITNGALATAGIGGLLASASCNDQSVDNAGKTADKTHDEIFPLQESTIQELQEMMTKGTTSAVAIVNQYLKRIDEIDQNGHNLRSVIELNTDAVSIAEAMDKERKEGKLRGPLHGIPVLLKDNINTGDKMQTTAGALAMQGNIALKDAFLVKKLRDGGAVILGKTNLSEWANFRSRNSCSGWSSRGGQTKNPYTLDHNPCGSSSGSGVAVSANLCAVAIGTETDGSITCPASVNGIVGIKPTVGLVSRSGIIPISHTQDTAGPMARTVSDAALLLGIIAGADPEDKSTSEYQGKTDTDYTKFLIADGLKGKRIGVEKKQQGKNQYMHLLQQRAIDLLKQQGATIVEIEYLEQISNGEDAENKVLLYEFKDGVNRYLASSNVPVKTLKDVIEFNIANEDKAMPYFKQDNLERSEKTTGIETKEYKDAVIKSRDGSRKILDKVIMENQLDAICGLTMGPACSIDTIYGDRWGDVFLTMPAAVSGYPHISVPCGMVYALPVGLSFFGPAYSEPALITIAYGYEQASKNRIVPGFKPSFL